MFIVYLQMGILFTIIGLAIPAMAKRGPSKWIGIRTPLTMSNPDAWREVHRRGWLPFVLAGIASFIALWAVYFFKVETDMVLNLGIIFGIIVFMLIHLFLLVRQVAHELEIASEPVEKDNYNKAMEAQQKYVKYAGVAIGILFVILGLLSPAIGDMGPNSSTGIRTAKSMSSPEAWKEVHQQAMIPMIVCGLAVAIASWIIPGMKIKPGMRLLIWFVIVVLSIAIVLMVSS